MNAVAAYREVAYLYSKVGMPHEAARFLTIMRAHIEHEANELHKGAVSVVKPKGTEETGADRPAAPSYQQRARAQVLRSDTPESARARFP